ncbi:MAG TPA: non-canonical purine NTP diphosphatase [Bacteroidia bacterium]|jgi:XTP/dITP diphosphohydrolase
MHIVFATNNKNKIYEVSRSIGERIKLLSLEEIGCSEELPETQATLEGNALQKARYVFEKYGADCFADDTGLEIAALEGRPGVYSARYAGEEKNAEHNMKKVLEEMEGKADRSAKFRTVIALVTGGKEYLFEGAVEGMILEKKQGGKGFGYDPIFSPLSNPGISFAQMSIEEKNKISHRGIAVSKLVEFLAKI